MKTRALPVALALFALACQSEDTETPAPTPTPDAAVGAQCPEPEAPAPAALDLRPRARPIEYVGMTLTRPIDRAGFLDLAEPLFGAEAAAGQGHEALLLQPGVQLTVEPDPRTDEQVIVRVDLTSSLDPEDQRTITRVPVSLAYGELFIEAVQAAITQSEQLRARDPGDVQPWWLEYRARSPNGGSLDFRIEATAADLRLSITLNTPSTSLSDGELNTPAFGGEPYETIAGTVWFELGRDEFDFFVERAYGVTESAGQNFRDFHLKPHEWLRLTVTPKLAEERIDVAFEVITEDGRRLPFARSPASYVAGDLFKQTVLRMVDNMLDQEEVEPGSSTAWVVPFHYDDPQGGGVVRVVAQGAGGVFRIAYAVESPINPLRPVDFLPYAQRFEIPEEFPETETDCAEVGSEAAAQGYFTVTFDASSTVRNSRNLEAPLRGPIWGAIYKSSDVAGTGPNEGARPVADFAFEDVDLTDPEALTAFRINTQLTAGTYQILGFIDVDGNADPQNPDPDRGDPVTIPIGDYELSCAEQPVRVEFAILRP
ncbi:MAG: hypothetical protein KC620_02315 [Myxococcales bacterium]|nr:hypothetical protein [Myxococcales bacterium]